MTTSAGIFLVAEGDAVAATPAFATDGGGGDGFAAMTLSSSVTEASVYDVTVPSGAKTLSVTARAAAAAALDAVVPTVCTSTVIAAPAAFPTSAFSEEAIVP